MGPEAVRIANYCMDCLKRAKPRDFPPSTREIEGIISGKGLVCTINCVGGRFVILRGLLTVLCSTKLLFFDSSMFHIFVSQLADSPIAIHCW